MTSEERQPLTRQYSLWSERSQLYASTPAKAAPPRAVAAAAAVRAFVRSGESPSAARLPLTHILF